jgi:hypothetical protein
MRVFGILLCVFAGVIGFLCIVTGVQTPPQILLFTLAGVILILVGSRED